MKRNWINKNLRHDGSPAICETRVSSSILMSDFCIDFGSPSYNPNTGLAILAVGKDQREQEI